MDSLSFSLSFWIIILLIVVSGFLSYSSGKLTLAASATGVLIALLIYLGSGASGLIMLAVFFVLGTVVTSYKKQYKLKMRLAVADDSKRKTSQVLANAGVAAILSLLNIMMGYADPIFLVMISGSLASAMGDTFSSELGNVYGRNFYNILTLKRDQRGLDGVISFEGTLFGILGSIIIAVIYAATFGWNIAFFVIVVAGVVGNLSDSLLGALFERKGYLGNDAVNFLNTAIAALVALAIVSFIR